MIKNRQRKKLSLHKMQIQRNVSAGYYAQRTASMETALYAARKMQTFHAVRERNRKTVLKKIQNMKMQI